MLSDLSKKMPKNRQRSSQKSKAKRVVGNVAASNPINVTMGCSPTNDPSHRYGKDSLSQELKQSWSEKQKESSSEKQKDSSSKEQNYSSSKKLKDSSAREQKELSSERRKDSSSKKQKDSSLMEENYSLSMDQKDLSSKKRKDSSAKEQKELSSERREDSSARKQKDSSPKKQKDSLSMEEKDSLSAKQKDSSSEKQKDSSSKEQRDLSSKEKNDSSAKEQKELSSEKQKDLSSEKQKDSLSKKQKDSSAKEQKELSSEKQKDFSSEKQKDSSSKKQKDSSAKEQKESSFERRKDSSARKQKNSSSKKQKDSSLMEEKDSSSKEQKDSYTKDKKDLSSKGQQDSLRKDQKNSSSKEQKDSLCEDQKDSSSKEQKDSLCKDQKDSSSKEQQDSLRKDQKDLSSKEQKDSSSKEQRESLSKEQNDSSSKKQTDSSSKDPKDSPFKDQKDSLSTNPKDSSSKKQKDSSPKEQNTIILYEDRESHERSWERIVEFMHEREKPQKPATEKDPSNRGEHVINNGVLKIYRDVVEEFVGDFFGVNLSHLESNVLSEDSRVLQAIRKPVPQDVMDQIANVMVVHLEKLYMDSNAKAFGEKIDTLKGAVVGYMRLLYNPPDSPNLTGMERNIVFLVEDFIRGGFFVDDDALAIWLKRGNSLVAFERARDEVKSMLRRLIPHGFNNLQADWVNELRRRRLIYIGIHSIPRDVVEEFVTDVLGGNLKLRDLENKTLSRNSSVLRAIRELDAPKVMDLLCWVLVVDVRHGDSYQNYNVAWKIQKMKTTLVAHMKSIYSGRPNQTHVEFVEDFIRNEDYVDKDALRIWQGNGNSTNSFKEASGRVGSMLRRMVPCGRNNQLTIWVNELRNAAERLLEQRK